MKKQKGGAFVNDLDILGDVWFTEEPEAQEDDSIDDIHVLGDWANQETKTEEPKVEPKAEEPVVEFKVEEPKVEPTEPKSEPEKSATAEGEEDIDKWLDELLKNNAAVEEKIDEVKDAADATGDDTLIKVVDELQTLIAEKNLENEQLKKQVEVANNRYLEKFGWDEEFSIYKPEVEKLQNNPRLYAFVKYFGSQNEKIKPKLISIVSDFLFDLTGQDVSELLDNKDVNALGVLNIPGSDNQPMKANEVKEDKNMNYEESINDLF